MRQKIGFMVALTMVCFAFVIGIYIGFSYAERNIDYGSYDPDYETEAALAGGIPTHLAGQTSMDLNKAFDSISHEHLIQAMQLEDTYYFETTRTDTSRYSTLFEIHSCDFRLSPSTVVSFTYSYPSDDITGGMTTVYGPNHAAILPFLTRFQANELKTWVNTAGNGNSTYSVSTSGAQPMIFE